MPVNSIDFECGDCASDLRYEFVFGETWPAGSIGLVSHCLAELNVPKCEYFIE